MYFTSLLSATISDFERRRIEFSSGDSLRGGVLVQVQVLVRNGPQRAAASRSFGSAHYYFDHF